MITEAYQEERESLFSPQAFFGERKTICGTAIATFSHEIFRRVLEQFPHEPVGQLRSVNGEKPLFLIEFHGKKTIFYLSSIGSCGAGNEVIEMQWQTGIRHLIIFGSCGALDREATQGKVIVPTEAFRDEGMSYHYAPPADTILLKNSSFLSQCFDRLGVPYTKGKIWTTDAPYRETKTAVEKRKRDGCIAVEMEAAGLQAVCNFQGVELYSFLVTGDLLGGETYLSDGLESANHSLGMFRLALQVRKAIPEP